MIERNQKSEGTPKKTPPLPVIRYFSSAFTKLILPLPISPNFITSASFGLGLAAAWSFSLGSQKLVIVGAILFLLCYLLDNVDGEVARAKNQCTPFGAYFDTFVDWIVHAAFFIGLGWGAVAKTGDDIWLWFAGSAAAGATINYVLSLFEIPDDDVTEETASTSPSGFAQWTAFLLRELFRADFCFLVLALSLFDALHYLLAAAAVGAHAYWLIRSVKGARNFHV